MSLTDYLIKRKYPGHLLIDKDMAVVSGTLDIHIAKRLIAKHFPKHHIHLSPGEMRKAKKAAWEDQEMKGLHEDPQTETTGD